MSRSLSTVGKFNSNKLASLIARISINLMGGNLISEVAKLAAIIQSTIDDGAD